MAESIVFRDLGRMAYRDAWALQEQLHAEVLAGGPGTILIVEHPPVITLGRRPGVQQNLRVAEDQLPSLGVELVQSDRGGDITFHGPGQIVVYPIIRLADHDLTVSGYVHRLEATVIAALSEIGISAKTDPAAVGVWTTTSSEPAKICAIGVRIRRGVTMHGIALNVDIDLNYYNLIIPCGLTRPVTSIQNELADHSPNFAKVKEILTRHFAKAFTPSPTLPLIPSPGTPGEG